MKQDGQAIKYYFFFLLIFLLPFFILSSHGKCSHILFSVSKPPASAYPITIFLRLSQFQHLEWYVPALPISLTVRMCEFQPFQSSGITFSTHCALDNSQYIFICAFLITQISLNILDPISYNFTIPCPARCLFL